MNDVQPTKNKIFTFKDLDIEATLIQKIASNYLHRFRGDGGYFDVEFGSIAVK